MVQTVVGHMTGHHVAVEHIAGRYPFVPTCSCGWRTRGYAAAHAAETVADAHGLGMFDA